MRVCRECGNPRKKYSTYCEECTQLHKKQAWQKANKDRCAKLREKTKEKHDIAGFTGQRMRKKKIYTMDDLTLLDKKILYFISPGPKGLGMLWKNAAKALNIKLTYLSGRMRLFKKHYPVEWENYKSLWRVAIRQRVSLHGNSYSLDQEKEERKTTSEENIKEIF